MPSNRPWRSSTFGRRAVNDGKLDGALFRNGGRITTDTLDRIHGFMMAHPPHGPRPIVIERPRETRPTTMPPLQPAAAAGKTPDPQQNFRFFDNRQKYLIFVNTCSEKWVVADRVARWNWRTSARGRRRCACSTPVSATEPCSARVMRAMHAAFPTMPFYVVGKEISLEDVRLTLEKIPDRFFEHPATVLILTNLGLCRSAVAHCQIVRRRARAWSGKRWRCSGNCSHEFEQQIDRTQAVSVRELAREGQRQDRQSRL